MKKVLVVDDSSTTLMMEQMVLRQRPNYRCVTASNGLEAVQQALTHRPDLILMDVVMPKMNGFEACRELRKRSETQSTPIVLVTTRGEPEYLEAGYRSGCNDYLNKPIEASELLRVVESYIGK